MGVLVEASLQLEAKATAHSVLTFVALLKQSHSSFPAFEVS